jgi:hypothetical protein
MSQLLTLIWLKWRLFRNSLRSRKATINQVASITGTVITLVVALLIALGLGLVAYAVTAESSSLPAAEIRVATRTASEMPPAYFVLFIIFSFLYLLWATLPLSIGGGNQFDPGRLLMYPISLRKLFAIDLISELASLSSLFAVPAILALAIGVGLGTEATGSLPKALIVTIPTISFGIVLAKWLATSIGALMQKRRSRGETLVALIGGAVALGGALIGQLAPIAVQYYRSFSGLRWTPPGAAALALVEGVGGRSGEDYVVALVTLVAYTVPLILATYWIAQRAVLGRGGLRPGTRAKPQRAAAQHTGWELPLLPADLSALVEKEFRYALRNVQLRMMALMPLILIVIRFMNSRTSGSRRMPRSILFPAGGFSEFGQGLIEVGGVLYVFMILSGLACNQFAFEEGGMKTLILAPVERRKILTAKNIVMAIVALGFSTVLLVLNEIAFRDLTPRSLLFVALSFVIFAVMMSLAGNWFSIQFPKRMKFGKRMNNSGMAGFLILPVLGVMTLPPLGAVAAGYLTQSLLIEYGTLALFAGFALALYFPIVSFQGHSLERHEHEILEVVGKEADV